MHATEALATSRRAMEVCNACRYCEGFCAVFPAMELRRGFTDGDLSYLANLCHNCQGCYHACQYAPPHPFGINVPQSFSLLRMESYEQHAWPAPLARLFQRNAMVSTFAVVVAILLVLGIAMLVEPETLYAVHHGKRSFYAVIPWGMMAGLAGLTFLYALTALAMSTRNFWRASGAAGLPAARPILAALHDVLTLKNLGGGGHGCNDRSERFSMLRRRLHHAMFYGFVLCFLSTCSGFVLAELLGDPAPYPFLSVPVLLGTSGGVLMVGGIAGWLWIKASSDPGPAARGLAGADLALLISLLLAAMTGLLLLAFRASAAMGVLLSLHLAIVLALFLLLPYTKFVHGMYRSAALLRAAMERPAA